MIFVPTHLLPENEEERYIQLSDYFADKTVSISPAPGGWNINLNWATTNDRYVDPSLLVGLEWWDGSFSVDRIPYALRRYPKYQISLSDSWTIYSWSEWLSKKETFPEEIVLLHIDDHDDLMSPRLTKEQNGWRDLISKQSVNFLEPSSVSTAILSGAIGVGSFLIPLIHSIKKVHVRHLCATRYSQSRLGIFSIKTSFEADTILEPGTPRPKIKLLDSFQASDVADSVSENKSTYYVSAEPQMWLANLVTAPVFLHIDMDYFNNRFNGDSDWMQNLDRYDPSLSQVLQNIDEVFDALVTNGLPSKIVDIAVALSPGFFPAEYWSEAVRKVTNRIEQLQM